MKVLSLFDGISCGALALEGKFSKYYSSEIDKTAIDVSRFNHPEIIRVGDVRDICSNSLPNIDLLIGGSPCTNLSFAGNGEGLISPNLDDYLSQKKKGIDFKGQSYLFWEWVRLKEELNPKWWLLENVRMSKKHREVIDSVLGKPVFVESSNFSGSLRKRFYWTNIPVPKVWVKNKDYFILKNNSNSNENKVMKDYWCGGVDITNRYEAKRGKTKKETMGEKCPPGKEKEIALTWVKALANTRTLNDKAKCLTATGQGISNSGATNVIIGERVYTLDSQTSELLMTLPLDYTKFGKRSNGDIYELTSAKRDKAIGNGWTVDVIKHIFDSIPH